MHPMKAMALAVGIAVAGVLLVSLTTGFLINTVRGWRRKRKQ